MLKKAIEKEKDELLNEVVDAFDVKSDVSLAAEDFKKGYVFKSPATGF